VDIFTKSWQRSRIDYICNKLGTYDLCAPTWGGLLNVTGLTHIFCYSFMLLYYYFHL